MKYTVSWILAGTTEVEAESKEQAEQIISDMSNKQIVASHNGFGIDLEFTSCYSEDELK